MVQTEAKDLFVVFPKENLYQAAVIARPL